jgi:hypothetical protein
VIQNQHVAGFLFMVWQISLKSGGAGLVKILYDYRPAVAGRRSYAGRPSAPSSSGKSPNDRRRVFTPSHAFSPLIIGAAAQLGETPESLQDPATFSPLIIGAAAQQHPSATQAWGGFPDTV